ncbi:MAG: hypothetical protein AAFP92_20795, partial [Bacteroidota bacterium]
MEVAQHALSSAAVPQAICSAAASCGYWEPGGSLRGSYPRWSDARLEARVTDGGNQRLVLRFWAAAASCRNRSHPRIPIAAVAADCIRWGDCSAFAEEATLHALSSAAVPQEICSAAASCGYRGTPGVSPRMISAVERCPAGSQGYGWWESAAGSGILGSSGK